MTYAKNMEKAAEAAFKETWPLREWDGEEEREKKVWRRIVTAAAPFLQERPIVEITHPTDEEYRQRRKKLIFELEFIDAALPHLKAENPAPSVASGQREAQKGCSKCGSFDLHFVPTNSQWNEDSIKCAACGYEVEHSVHPSEDMEFRRLNAIAARPAPDERPAAQAECVCGHPHRADGSCTVCISCIYTAKEAQPASGEESVVDYNEDSSPAVLKAQIRFWKRLAQVREDARRAVLAEAGLVKMEDVEKAVSDCWEYIQDGNTMFCIFWPMVRARLSTTETAKTRELEGA